jgi:hypothetical protein
MAQVLATARSRTLRRKQKVTPEASDGQIGPEVSFRAG